MCVTCYKLGKFPNQWTVTLTRHPYYPDRSLVENHTDMAFFLPSPHFSRCGKGLIHLVPFNFSFRFYSLALAFTPENTAENFFFKFQLFSTSNFLQAWIFSWPHIKAAYHIENHHLLIKFHCMTLLTLYQGRQIHRISPMFTKDRASTLFLERYN